MEIAGIDVKLEDVEALVQRGYTLDLDDNISPVSLSKDAAGDERHGYITVLTPHPHGHWSAHVVTRTGRIPSIVAIAGWVHPYPMEVAEAAEKEAERLWQKWRKEL